MHLLIATCSDLPDGDEDGPALTEALNSVGVTPRWVAWSDTSVDWSTAPVLIRSTWDYTARRAEFLAWADRVPTLINPAPVVRWNSDKTYLLDLAAEGLPITPTTVLAPGAELVAPAAEFVVKPSVGAGSRGAGRFGGDEVETAAVHAAALHAAGRTVLVQPYLDQVDAHGETALLYFGGVFSHAVRKGPMLSAGAAHGLEATTGLWIEENITPRVPSEAELAVGAAAVDLLGGRFGAPLTYTRVDLLPSADGPVLVELELTEPSLFLSHAEGAADRFARVVADRLAPA